MSKQDETVVEFVHPDQILESLASQRGENLVIPHGSKLTRKQVAENFHEAFELIGGVPRLAHWANENLTDFYKLYAKLFPSTSGDDLKDVGTFRIIHVLPRTALDGDVTDAENDG